MRKLLLSTNTLIITTTNKLFYGGITRTEKINNLPLHNIGNISWN